MNTPMEAPAAHTLARNSDPGTSHQAARMAGDLARDHAERISIALFEQAKLALGAEQLAALTGLDAYQVRKRLPELQRLGVAEPTGETRKTASGRQERLWRAKVRPS